MFVEAIRRHIETLPASQMGWLAGLRDPVVGLALAALHAEPARPWTVEGLAHGVGQSRSVFAERFTEMVGQPPMQYLALWRMQLASHLLVATASRSAGPPRLSATSPKPRSAARSRSSSANRRRRGVETIGPDLTSSRQEADVADIPTRELGSTGERVSAIGLGGWHLALPHVSAALADRLIRTAVDRGMTFLDNCWDYNGGASERRMGKALRGGLRQKVFLMTKIDGRSGTAGDASAR